MIAIALGPILIRQVTIKFGIDLVPPNLDQLCDCTIVFWPAMSMVMSISLVRALILCSKVKPGLRASVIAFMFALASLVLASLMCCAQLFERIIISHCSFLLSCSLESCLYYCLIFLKLNLIKALLLWNKLITDEQRLCELIVNLSSSGALAGLISWVGRIICVVLSNSKKMARMKGASPNLPPPRKNFEPIWLYSFIFACFSLPVNYALTYLPEHTIHNYYSASSTNSYVWTCGHVGSWQKRHGIIGAQNGTISPNVGPTCKTCQRHVIQHDIVGP